MTRRPRPEELRLWAVVASTVRPAPGRSAEVAPNPKASSPTAHPGESRAPPAGASFRSRPSPGRAEEVGQTAPPRQATDIEPGRKRRLARGRDPIALTLDLHGLDQDRARTAMIGFLRRAHENGERAVLVITGKGARGDGVLRRSAPDWLADPALRTIVAGWSAAHRRHGGEGALYVALKRRGGEEP